MKGNEQKNEEKPYMLVRLWRFERERGKELKELVPNCLRYDEKYHLKKRRYRSSIDLRLEIESGISCKLLFPIQLKI